MKILMLAGGYDQIDLIKELQSRGHEVILMDYMENPPAKEYVEKHFQISTLDENAVYQLAVREKIELVTTVCTDQALPVAAKVSERLGLPFYLSSSTAQNITNKTLMKRKFNEYAVPSAGWIILEENNRSVGEIERNWKFPLVVKPCDANSSKGVTKVGDSESLAKAVDNAFEISRDKKVIVENYMEGEEISTDVWKGVEGVKVLLVSGTNKIRTQEGYFAIYQSRYPIELSETVKIRIQDIAERICKAFELENTPLLIQAVVNGDEISVIECSARIGGGTKHKLIQHITGIDIMSIYADRILGNRVQNLTVNSCAKKVELNYVYGNCGVFQKLVGFQERVASGDIVDVFQYKKPGSEICKRTTSSDRILGFMIEADTCEELQQKRYEILETIDVLDGNGKSMIYKECFYQ